MKQHPMFPRRGVSLPDLSKIPVFIGAGLRDPLIPPEITKELVSELTSNRLLGGRRPQIIPLQCSFS